MLRFMFTAIAASGLATVVVAPVLASPAPPAPVPPELRTGAKVTRIIDGDTIVTTRGTVRLAGIDTPELGRCGFGPATANAKRLAPIGSKVTLTRVPGKNRDRFGRYLRYMSRNGVDFGGAQVKAGLADARHDSRDGSRWHPNQASYIRWDRSTPAGACPP